MLSQFTHKVSIILSNKSQILTFRYLNTLKISLRTTFRLHIRNFWFLNPAWANRNNTYRSSSWRLNTQQDGVDETDTIYTDSWPHSQEWRGGHSQSRLSLESASWDIGHREPSCKHSSTRPPTFQWSTVLMQGFVSNFSRVSLDSMENFRPKTIPPFKWVYCDVVNIVSVLKWSDFIPFVTKKHF